MAGIADSRQTQQAHSLRRRFEGQGIRIDFISSKRRTATARGAMLADPAMLGNSLLEAAESLFDPQFWADRGEVSNTPGGRGAAWFISCGERQWVLRHCRRGGLLAPVTGDRYVWLGEPRVRAFAEWRMLESLIARGLPVPKPVAASYQRGGLLYRCDLITERVPHSQPLSAALAAAPLPESVWREVGAVIARLHRAGADHADLNAHNILCGEGISVIDFDRGRLRPPGAWRHGNLARLRRSLEKISPAMPGDRFSAREWDWLLAGYQGAG
jgi:3-deoxy-D-manno-octulosonic acid kinase